jgi:hypothetical protein
LNTLPTRTGDSDLSDDELLVFDMLFDCNASADQLSASVYGIHMNCEYNHSLDDGELSETIASLLSRNLIRPVGKSANSPAIVYSLNESGGKLWELERRPAWNHYVTTSQKELGTFSAGSIVALCVDESVGRKCLGAMFASGLIKPTGSIRSRSLYDKRIVPWKSFPLVMALRCRTSDNVHHGPKPIEWDAYHSSRCWWRSIDELLTLRR